MGNRRRAAYLSRDKHFLLQVALAILAVAFLVSFLVHRIFGDQLRSGRALDAIPESHIQAPGSGDLADDLDSVLAGSPIDRERLAVWVREFGRMWRLVRDRANEVPEVTGGEPAATRTNTIERLSLRIAEAPLTPDEARLFDAFLRAVAETMGSRAAAVDFLREQAERDPPPRFANEFLAYAHAMDDEPGAAIDAYLAEWQAHESEFARRAAATIALQTDDREALERIVALPGFAAGLPPEFQLEIAVRIHDYLGVARNHVRLWTRGYGWPEVILTILCALVWFVIVGQTAGVTGRRALVWGLPSIALGVLSILLTLVFISLQETHTAIRETGEVLQDAVYYVAGVGLREEAAKLLLFALLLPVLVRRRSEVLAIACAGWVGLGFAVEENIRYFQGDASVWPRFLTANFLHLSTTGIAGLALYRLARHPKRHWEGFLAAFLGVVGLHGFYDLAIANPRLAPETGALGILFIAVLAFWFFQCAAEARASAGHLARTTVSPLGVFVVGSALLVGAALVYAGAFTAPFSEAVANVGQAALGMVPVAFLFINRFRSE